MSWTEKITHEKVLRSIEEKLSMVETIVWRKKNWMEHIMRGIRLMKEVVEEYLRTGRGCWIKIYRYDCDLLEKEQYGDLKRRAIIENNNRHNMHKNNRQ